ncbi:MAG: hypothetical protein SAK29_13840 [Scytonema sp. PMC 1069.18]|nr:hypothetical protein [Scytonema sp. PMC 1069.18]MEC4886751.1 hypothetical protein [Scytonema sp. PMC 1070.18]
MKFLKHALSHHGYGARPDITNDQFQNLLEKVKQINKNNSRKPYWSRATESEIIKWCEETLKQLEA